MRTFRASLRIPQSHHAVVNVEEYQKPPYRKSNYLLSDQLVLHRQHKTVPYHMIQYQAEEGGRYEYALSTPQVTLKCGAWYLFCQVKTSCWHQNTAKSQHIWGPEQYTSKVTRRRPRSTVSYAF